MAEIRLCEEIRDAQSIGCRAALAPEGGCGFPIGGVSTDGAVRWEKCARLRIDKAVGL